MAFLYGRAGCLTAKNAGFRPVQYGQLDTELSSSLGPVQAGAFYLVSVDDMGRRVYARKPSDLGRSLGRAESQAKL
jgi:hypothetical protein